jgi:hypothetical protein
LPRDLGDVLHYFLPEPESAEDEIRVPAPFEAGRNEFDADLPPALPLLALPVGDRDVVRAALAWNLAVEIARLGGRVSLVTRLSADTPLIWPESGPGPLGTEVVHTPAQDMVALHCAALDVAVARAAEAREGGVVLLCVPPTWLHPPGPQSSLLRWFLLFSTADRRDLMETYALAKTVLSSDRDTCVGVTIHGARRIADAEQAFDRLAGVASRHLHKTPVSYGLLVDDLHVYRAIVARRPIGLEHPQSPAARALRDVAQLVLEDARKSPIG